MNSYQLRDIDFVASKPKVPRWKGRYFQWSISVGVSSSVLLDRRIFVFSSGKRSTINRYLFLKFLWDSLSSREFLLFLSTPENLENPIFLAIFRLIGEGNSKKTIRRRLLQLEHLFGIPEDSRERYTSMRSMRLEIHLSSRILRKVTKYSGYTKHYKDQGSLRPQLPEFLLDATTESSYFVDNEISWYNALSVGEISLLGEIYTLPDESRSGTKRRKSS